MNKKSKPYLPRERTGYEPSNESLISKSPEGEDTTLANTATDPIVVNNIVCSEFDYTEEPYVDSDLDTNP